MRQCQRIQLRLLHRISCVLLAQARVDTGTVLCPVVGASQGSSLDHSA